MPSTIINISNRLPITVTDTSIKQSSGGLVAALQAIDPKEFSLIWLGWPGSPIEPERQHELTAQLRDEFNCVPVFLSLEETRGHYDGFSNSSLWPLLHYMPTYMRYEPAWWEQYRAVNQRFAEKAAQIASPGDMVWVHDYQLMLVPTMLREMMPSLRVGFFLHTPFPSYEIFRCHPKREELLRGLLGADLIGFHTFGYMRHFRSAVLRLLGVDSEIARIHHGGSDSHLGVYPIGVDAARFEQQLASSEHRQKVQLFGTQYSDQRVVLSVERLDYTKGILRRLDAIELFLQNCDDINQIKFIFISVPSRQHVGQYQDLRAEVESRIGRINGRFATVRNSPIHFIHGSVQFSELCALYSMADVGLVTPLWDGMNLVAKEYVACQREEPGVLIVSEFAGAAVELFSAIVVNPFDPGAVAAAIEQALQMPLPERHQRMQAMRMRVMKYDAAEWARTFLEDLGSYPPQQEEDVASVSDARKRLRDGIADPTKRVAMFLDYDGTLREFEAQPKAAGPTAAIRAVIDLLVNTPNVELTIVSGRTPADLESFLGNYSIGLVAEHGAAIRRPGTTDWEDLDRNINLHWKNELIKILRLYEEGTPGSFIEEKRTSLVWHYRRADPEFGQWRANELVTELSAATANEPVQVRHGNKIVEVVAAQISKGLAVQRLVEQTPYDLILVAGDDVTDESMFRLQLENLVTIKVGEGDTHAQFRLPTPAAFRTFLRHCVERGPSGSGGARTPAASSV